MKQNEQAARKIYDLKKKIRIYVRLSKQKSYKRKSRYTINVSTKRVDKLLNKLTKQSQNYIKTEKKMKIKVSRRSLDSIIENTARRKFKKSCRHCNNNHWNKDCKNRKNNKKILFTSAMKDENSMILDEKDIKILKTLKKDLVIDSKNDQ